MSSHRTVDPNGTTRAARAALAALLALSVLLVEPAGPAHAAAVQATPPTTTPPTTPTTTTATTPTPTHTSATRTTTTTTSSYVQPVEGVVIDRFRPPPHPYAAGNRGVDYRTAPLSPVRAAAAGTVVFAGQVGGTLHVTVQHRDGLRTSYSFLAAITVQRGDRVEQGTVLGRTGEVLHFGVRDRDGTYLDPESLLGRRFVTRLVPSGEDGATRHRRPMGEPGALRSVVRERLAPLASLTGRGMRPDLFLARLRTWGHYARELRADTHVRRIAGGMVTWWGERATCTPIELAPPRPGGRRIAVLVAGIGSTSEQASIDGVDTAGLGYAPGDVVRFSYAGGRTPRVGEGSHLASIGATTYTARDSQNDLLLSGARLEALLESIALAEPGVPIDVIAHSQGGVVARLAFDQGVGTGRLPRSVSTVVTLGSPHQGADLATAIDAVAADPGGSAALAGIQRLAGLELDPSLPSSRQLSETSPIIVALAARPVPAHVRFTSIGARGDLVVPAGRTDPGGDAARAGAPTHHTVVPLAGVGAHDALPRSPEAHREIALAIAGSAPTCRGLTQVSVDLVAAEAIGWAEDRLGATVAAGVTLTPP